MLHCDLIGDPANYYRGRYDYIDTADTYTDITIGDVLFCAGDNPNGTAGHFYERVSTPYTGGWDPALVDLSNSSLWQDLGTDREDSWITNGIAATPLLVGEEGDDFIPDGTVKYLKLSRKVANETALLILYSDNFGKTWNSSASTSVTTSNLLFGEATSQPTGRIFLVFYETEASPFESADNAEVLELGDVHATSKATEAYGAQLVNFLTNKIAVGSLLGRKYALDTYMLVSPDNTIQTSIAVPEHADATDQLTTTSPAVKALPYLTRENGKLYLQALFKEVKYDVSWGDDNKFVVVDDISTTTDDNGNTVLVGQKRLELPFFISDGD